MRSNRARTAARHLYEAAEHAVLSLPGLTPPGPDRVAALAEAAAVEIVDYLLFVDEAPLPGPIRGDSGFAAAFEAQGPRDRRGRSLGGEFFLAEPALVEEAWEKGNRAAKEFSK